MRNKSRCEVISASTLLLQFLLEAVDLPPRYESAHDRALIDLMLLELAAMPVREFDIPLPQQPALLAMCQAFLLAPAIHDPAERWASALFMSASTFVAISGRKLACRFPPSVSEPVWSVR